MSTNAAASLTSRRSRRKAVDALRDEMSARPAPARLAWRPEEFAEACGVPLSSVRSWLADYIESSGRSGLPHTRPMPHTILIWSDDVADWRRATGALRRAAKIDFAAGKISAAEIPGGVLDEGPGRADEAGEDPSAAGRSSAVGDSQSQGERR